MDNIRIAGIEWGCLAGQRPRSAGSNARLGPHGRTVRVPIVRLLADDGSSGFGLGHPTPDQASALLGAHLGAVVSPERGVLEMGLPCEYALWDLVAKHRERPVYALAAAMAGRPPPGGCRVPCYDTSLYFDDLHLASDRDAAALIAAEAQEGYERGHRAFKIKVGRGARHMPLEEGTRRDIAVVRAVREIVGPDATIMLDANNGYTLNLAKRVLEATGDCRVSWIEEAFHEDPVLYADLRAWLDRHNLPTLIADGEGEASPSLLEWAQQRLIDVIQYDIWSHGFTRWLVTGRQLATWQARSAPHHYGTWYGNYAACHLAPALDGFTFVEWDDATVPGLDAAGYTLTQGLMSVPAVPGFGLALDEETFRHAVETDGWRLTL